MYLITVIPIVRGIQKDHLTYFSLEAPALGSVVEIPVRKRAVSGIVVRVEMAAEKKSEIKRLPFGIRRMNEVKALPFLSSAFMHAAGRAADYHASSIGAVLSLAVPKPILESIDVIPKKQSEEETSRSGTRGDLAALQMATSDRFDIYKRLIREEFARKKSIFLCLPGRQEIQFAETFLGKGIESYTVILHGGLSKKVLVERWKKALVEKHPILIIATAYFLSLPRFDIGTIIFDSESSRAFSETRRPYLDFRLLAEYMSEKSVTRLIFGDSLLRTETRYRVKRGEVAEFMPLASRIVPSDSRLVDMRAPKGKVKAFQVVSDELRATLEQTLSLGGRAFLFGARKGLASLTVCQDCGTTVSCPVCGAPMVLHGKGKHTDKGEAENTFLCHHCGHRITSKLLCKNCGGWRLVPLGIGIETIEAELNRLFPDTPLFILDRDHVSTHSQAESLTRKFETTAGSILLGTELALSYAVEATEKIPIDLATIVSLDSFFAVPDFRMQEKIFHIILSLFDVSDRLVVQTRRPEEKVFDYALKGNVADFYRDEIAEREKFGFPPFKIFIKLTLEGKRELTRVKMEKIKEELKPYDVTLFESFSSTSSRAVVHGLLTLAPGSWPDEKLLAALRRLPLDGEARVNPDSLL